MLSHLSRPFFQLILNFVFFEPSLSRQPFSQHLFFGKPLLLGSSNPVLIILLLRSDLLGFFEPEIFVFSFDSKSRMMYLSNSILLDSS